MKVQREDLAAWKEESGLTIAQIAEKSGVPQGTLGKIFSGRTENPRKATLDAIQKVLMDAVFRSEGKAAKYADRAVDAGKGKIAEPQAVYGTAGKKPGEYTVADYFARTDEVRCELLDGEFYDMASPSAVHQIIVRELMLMLTMHIRRNKGRCIVIQSPIDVEFEGDDRTVLQPDVAVVCDRSKLRRHIVGAPDLAIEIVSPSSRRRDMGPKMNKYGERGVREYWIVDPERQKIVVYDFEHDWDIRIYGFSDRVPVNIWDGQCEIDFAEISGFLTELENA